MVLELSEIKIYFEANMKFGACFGRESLAEGGGR